MATQEFVVPKSIPIARVLIDISDVFVSKWMQRLGVLRFRRMEEYVSLVL